MQADTTSMILVPAGMLERGSHRSVDEQPVAKVALSAFYIDRMPVTNRDFMAFLEAGAYGNPSLWTPAGWSYVQSNGITRPTYWHDPLWGAPEMPVTGVSWWEALAYARFRGTMLPTEAQWECACRGAQGLTYPWGEEEPTLEHANFAPGCEPIERRPTAPDAHSKNVSPFGCVDMVGNFAEWCLDNYLPSYEYDGATDPDPVFLSSEEDEHVVRGGCGLHSEDYLRCSARDCYPPGLRDNLIGFRCAAPLVESERN